MTDRNPRLDRFVEALTEAQGVKLQPWQRKVLAELLRLPVSRRSRDWRNWP